MALQCRPWSSFTTDAFNQQKKLARAPHSPRLNIDLYHRKLHVGYHGLEVSRIPRSSAIAMASSSPTSSAPSSPSKEAAALSDITVFTCDGKLMQFQQLWDQDNETAVVAFLRHFGCIFCWEFAASLRDAKPKFDAAGVKLITIGVGTPDKAQILAERLPYPKEVLFADPDRKAYNALGLYYGIGRTFFNPASAKVINRIDAVQKALKGYTPNAIPKDSSSVLQQGGMYVFRGKELLYARKDEGTGDHASLDDVLNICCSLPVP